MVFRGIIEIYKWEMMRDSGKRRGKFELKSHKIFEKIRAKEGLILFKSLDSHLIF
jgi:hypothetical protein